MKPARLKQHEPPGIHPEAPRPNVIRRVALRTSLAASLGACLMISACHSRDRLPAPGTKPYTDFISAFYTGLAGLQVGDDTRAESSLAHAASLVPGEPAAWVDWGILALRQRTFDFAAERLNRAATLAPKNDRIDFLLGLLEAARGNQAAAIAHLRAASSENPRNLRALYRLATEIEREGAPDSDTEVQRLLQQILTVQPDNLAALVDLCRIAAKRGDAATLHSALARVASHAQPWSPEIKAQLTALQTAASAPETRPAATRSTFLRNVLMREPSFRANLAELAANPGEETEPFTRFLRLANPPSSPAPPDIAITFTPEPSLPGHWSWFAALPLSPLDPPTLAVADPHHLHLATGPDLPFAATNSPQPPAPESILPLDVNYDFKPDLLLTGPGGLRLYRQDDPSHFTDVTSATRLPPPILTAPYTGAWALDIEADGDLDILLGTLTGEPTVLRNNGDTTFTPIHPFPGVFGIRQFTWADLNGDGNPDAALLDGSGRLHIFLNQRAGHFAESPTTLPALRAITAADTAPDSALRLIALTESGTLLELSYKELSYNEPTATWTIRDLAHLPTPIPGTLRLRAADFDNNGAVDLAILSPAATTLFLQDEHNAFHPIPTLPPAQDAADLQNNGRLDLLGLTPDGTPIIARNHGTRDYHWQTIRPHARVSTGDQRINPFGVGGEIEIRSGLLVQRQPITGPALHFGLGLQKQVDVARIVWPNGSMRAEFALEADQQIVTEQRLKGSCPFLFAWNGASMAFVKDSVPWGSAIGLRINALGTADIAATEEWYKIGRDQLTPRDGFYDLRITGELWETYFYDSLALIAVDHPAGTEIFTDERYRVPAVKLAITATALPQPILRATDDNGTDVTATVRTLDGLYLDTFGRGQYQGITRDHFVEIALPEALPASPILIAKGWLHPSDSSVNVAMGQGTHPRPQWLSLETEDPQGHWHTVRPNLGFPAGRNKTCLIDLTGIFPPGTPHRLRLRTNLEVFWDQVEWAEALPAPHLQTQRLQPGTADIRYRGFSTIHQSNPSSPELPDYNHLAATHPIWRDLAGFYTRFGDVRELLAAPDDRYVIMNAGDELALRFAAPAPPPPGYVRDFILAGDGWIKDGDFNSAFSQTVLPYPHHARTNYDGPPTRLEQDWMLQHHPEDWLTYQTRYITGTPFRDALKPDASNTKPYESPAQ